MDPLRLHFEVPYRRQATLFQSPSGAASQSASLAPATALNTERPPAARDALLAKL